MTYINLENDKVWRLYMFNVDKEGKQLGFKIPLETEISIPLKYRDEEDKLVDLNKSLVYKKYPCISLEGTSNTSFAAAGAFYTLDEYNQMSVDPDTGEVPENKKYFGIKLELNYTHRGFKDSEGHRQLDYIEIPFMTHITKRFLE